MDGWITRDKRLYRLFLGTEKPELVPTSDGAFWCRGLYGDDAQSTKPLFGIPVEMHQCVPVRLSAQLSEPAK